MDQLKAWLEAFYLPCKVEILPFRFEQDLINIKAIDRKKNCYGKTQFNAIHILKHFIGGI